MNFDEVIQLKGLWVLFGVVIAGVSFWFANRKVFQLQSLANENLFKTLQRSCENLERERNEYREHLHTERATHQISQLRIKELEARPDITGLETLLVDQREWMRVLGKSMTDHAANDAAIFKSINDTLSAIAVRVLKDT
jgi:replication-associated recombination protein RarA